jgi:hypothetical protein
VTVDNSNNIHVAAMMNSASSSVSVIRYSFFNGTSWSTAVDLATSNVFGSALGTTAISTDGTDVWVFWSDRTGVLGATDTGKIVYKKGVAPFASGIFDVGTTAVNSDERVFDKVWSYVSSAYSDETTDAGNITTADTQLVSNVGDIVYFGMSEKFRFVNVSTSTNGTGGVLAYEYWDGSSWTSLTTVGSANSNLTACTGGGGSVSCGVWFNPPANWAKTTINSESAPGYFYVRARVTTNYTVSPVGSQARAMGRLDNVSSIANRSGYINLIWSDNLNGLTPMNVQNAAFVTGSNINPENPTS